MLVSIEVIDSSICLWHSCRSRIWSILYVLNVTYNFLTGRLVHEKVDPAAQRVEGSEDLQLPCWVLLVGKGGGQWRSSRGFFYLPCPAIGTEAREEVEQQAACSTQHL